MEQQRQQQQQQSTQEASSSSISPSYEQLLRSEVNRGCQQVKQFEQKLQSLIQSPAFYPALIFDAASIISTFASVIAQLNRGDPKQAIATAAAAITAPPLLSIPTIRPSIQLPSAANTSSATSSPMACSPIRASTPPHSPPNLASPHSSSPAMTPSTTPEGSPNNPPSTMSLDGGAAIDPVGGSGGAAAATAMEEFPASGSGRKRKCLPKRVVRQPASSNEHGGESPADDGFTWRKYGQKDILNSRFPRSYYRCTHQKELRCQATKYVQKCEDEPSTFQVTYIGEHSCQSLQSGGFWMRSSARPLLENPFSGSSTGAAASSLALPSSGPLYASSSSPFSSRLEEMKLTLSPSRPAAAYNIFRATTSLTSPSQWMTPRFGVVNCPVKTEPLAAPSTLATTLLQPESSPSSVDSDKRLLRMSLGASSSSVMAGPSISSASTPAPSSSPAPIGSAASAAGTAAAESSATGEHESIQGLWNLEELPEFMSQKVGTLDDIHEIMGYDEPMLFESDQ